MTVEADMLEMYESEVVLKPLTAIARDLSKTWGDPVSIQAHVEPEQHLVTTLDGQELVSMGRVFLDSVYGWVDTSTQLTMPQGEKPLVQVVETTYGPNLDTGTSGPYQTVIHYGGG